MIGKILKILKILLKKLCNNTDQIHLFVLIKKPKNKNKKVHILITDFFLHLEIL